MKAEPVIISLGGSLICPSQPDSEFLKAFKELVNKHVEQGKRFVLVTGGGKVARNYLQAAIAAGASNSQELDWLGIQATRLNAQLVKSIFGAEAKLFNDPEELADSGQGLSITGGWKPGRSTDYVAVMLAEKLGVKKIINLTSTDYVYDKDPRRFSDARPFKKLSWHDFRNIFGNEWEPGMSSPFDPVASREAENNKMLVYIINGAKLDNFDQLLTEKKFKGTIIG